MRHKTEAPSKSSYGASLYAKKYPFHLFTCISYSLVHYTLVVMEVVKVKAGGGTLAADNGPIDLRFGEVMICTQTNKQNKSLYIK